jgi:hypothetical protein
VKHALDDIRDFAGSVVTGSGQFLHAGRIHSHSAGVGNRCSSDQCDQRSTARRIGHRSQRDLIDVTLAN